MEHAKHEALCLQDLVNRISTVHHVDNFLDRRTVNLFILGGDEDSSRADQLQLAQGYNFARQESINVVDTKEQSLGQKVEPMMDLDNPIHKDGSHGPLDLRLIVHVMSIGQHFDLEDCVSKIVIVKGILHEPRDLACIRRFRLHIRQPL